MAPEPTRATPRTGELVTKTFGYDGGRPVTVYVPPDPPEAVVFAGDGQLIAQWAAAADADVVPAERAGDHGGPFWQAEFAPMVAWAFGR